MTAAWSSTLILNRLNPAMPWMLNLWIRFQLHCPKCRKLLVAHSSSKSYPPSRLCCSSCDQAGTRVLGLWTIRMFEDVIWFQVLTYIENFLDERECIDLLINIDQRPWLNDLRRRVQHYGYKYDYTAKKIDLSMRLGPLPDFLSSSRGTIRAILWSWWFFTNTRSSYREWVQAWTGHRQTCRLRAVLRAVLRACGGLHQPRKRLWDGVWERNHNFPAKIDIAAWKLVGFIRWSSLQVVTLYSGRASR